MVEGAAFGQPDVLSGLRELAVVVALHFLFELCQVLFFCTFFFVLIFEMQVQYHRSS